MARLCTPCEGPTCGPRGVVRPSARLAGRPVGPAAGRRPVAPDRFGTATRADRPRPVSRGARGDVQGACRGVVLAGGGGDSLDSRYERLARRSTGRTPRAAPIPRCGACAQVRQDLVDHGRLGNERHDPHRADASGARERVDLEDQLQQCRPAAGGIGGGQPRRGHGQHGRIGSGGLRPAAHAAGAVGIPAIVLRGDLPLVGDVNEDRARNSSGSAVSVPAAGPSDLSDR